MNISLKLFLFCSIFVLGKSGLAQVQVRAGFLPSINYNRQLEKNWEVNFRVESRHFVYDNELPNRFTYRYSLTDISALAGKKVGLNSKLVAGVLTRLEPGAFAVRSIQQFTFQTHLKTTRIVHRIASDQTFAANETPEFRLRYRWSAEFPIAGQKIDVKEFYVKFSNEFIASAQDGSGNLEVRAIPTIGYVINEKHKLELGIDNRAASLLENQTRYSAWMTLNWFFR